MDREKFLPRLEKIWVDSSFTDPRKRAEIMAPLAAIPVKPKRKIYVNAEALLTAEQEKHLFRQYNFLKYQIQKHWPKPKVDSLIEQAYEVQNRIVLANVRLAVSIVSKKFYFTNHREDLIADAYAHLIHVIDCFDWRLGIKFSTYATVALLNKLKYQQMCYQKHTSSPDPEEFLNLEPDREHDDKDYKEIKEVVQQLLKHVSQRQHDVLRCVFLEEKTLDVIGKQIGITKERVRQIRIAAIDKIKGIVENENLHSLGIVLDS